LPAGCNKCCKH